MVSIINNNNKKIRIIKKKTNKIKKVQILLFS
jgi:hypothetical protein